MTVLEDRARPQARITSYPLPGRLSRAWRGIRHAAGCRQSARSRFERLGFRIPPVAEHFSEVRSRCPPYELSGVLVEDITPRITPPGATTSERCESRRSAQGV